MNTICWDDKFGRVYYDRRQKLAKYPNLISGNVTFLGGNIDDILFLSSTVFLYISVKFKVRNNILDLYMGIISIPFRIFLCVKMI